LAESGLPWELAVSGQVGTDFGTLGEDKDKVAWDPGVSRSFFDEQLTLDLRYHDSNLDPARFVATVAIDTGFAAFSGK
jgi:hypothetical protein